MKKTYIFILLAPFIIAAILIFFAEETPESYTSLSEAGYIHKNDKLTSNDWYKYINTELGHTLPSKLCRNGERKTAFFVALSGGGSRAANLAAQAILKFGKDGLDIDHKIDGIFSVSGGSIAAGLYGISRDDRSLDDGRPIWSADLVERLTYDIERSAWLQIPASIAKGHFSRSSILEDVIDENILKKSSTPFTIEDLNQDRPPIFIQATIANQQSAEAHSPPPFGSLFIFSRPDFIRIGSSVESVKLSRAISASAAFPALLPPVTVRRYRLSTQEEQLGLPRYVHLIDGGNADNLGLLGIKRVLLEDDHRLLKDCDNIIVVSIDAFGKQGQFDDVTPSGTVISNFANSAYSSFDALLSANRTRLLGEFKARVFAPPGDEVLCRKDGLPDDVCLGGVRANWSEVNTLLSQKLFFLHINFRSPELISQSPVLHCNDNHDCKHPVDFSRLQCERSALISRLESIETKLSIRGEQALDIKTFIDLLDHPGNICFQHLKDIASGRTNHGPAFYRKATGSCDQTTSIAGNTPPPADHIRGNIFGDVITLGKIASHRELCGIFDKIPHADRVRWLKTAKGILIQTGMYSPRIRTEKVR